MAKVRVIENELVFNCPVCGQHRVPQGRWTLSGTDDEPTITPSVVETVNPPDHPSYRPGIPTTVCHSKVTDGKIHFCHDCTHLFANQTIPLKDIN